MTMNKRVEKNTRDLGLRRKAPLATRTDLSAKATKDIAAAMNGVLADAFALYMKTKNFHWHMSGPHFRDYHLRSEEHTSELQSPCNLVCRLLLEKKKIQQELSRTCHT